MAITFPAFPNHAGESQNRCNTWSNMQRQRHRNKWGLIRALPSPSPTPGVDPRFCFLDTARLGEPWTRSKYHAEAQAPTFPLLSTMK